MKTIKYKNGDVYSGDVKGLFKPVRHGHGTLTCANGDVYTGNWQEDKRHGNGEQKNANGDVLKGFWFEDSMRRGRIDYKNGNYYDGELWDGVYSNRGTLYVKQLGSTYTGSFRNGRKHGKGTEKTKEYTYVGEFANDRFHYAGRLNYKNGDWADGTFNLGKLISGKCKRTESDGSVYEGEIGQGVYNGMGKLVHKDGSVLSGRFAGGKLVEADETSAAPAQNPEPEKTAEKAPEKKPPAKEKAAPKPEKAGAKKTAAKKKTTTAAKDEEVEGQLIELRKNVKKAVDNALLQYDRVINPKTVLPGSRLVTPQSASADARYYAQEAKKRIEGFEERKIKENGLLGVLAPGAVIRKLYDSETKQYDEYTGGMNYQNQPHGYGRVIYSDGEVYEGEIYCGKSAGLGCFEGKEGTYKGEFLNSTFDGYGTIVYNDGTVFTGKFSEGSIVCGIRTDDEKMRYEGEFGSGYRSHGYGILYSENIELGGFFTYGNLLGNGYFKCDEFIFRGFYSSERKKGSGVIEYTDGKRYEGEVESYAPAGFGRLYDAPDGNVFISRFVNGGFDGYVEVTSPDGDVRCLYYENGKLLDGASKSLKS